MKLVCQQEDFKKALNIGEKNITGKNYISPILNNFLLVATKDSLKIVSTNLETRINVSIPAIIEEEGRTTVSARLLDGFISNISNQEVKMNIQNNKLKIEAGEFVSNLNIISADEFPQNINFIDENLITIKSELFKKGLVQIVDIASISESRPEISGIYFEIGTNNQLITMIATDGFRLAKKEIIAENISESCNGKSLIIPNQTIRELIQILNEKNCDVKILLNENKNNSFTQILFIIDNITIASRLIEGKYIDFKNVISDNFQTKVILKKDNLIKNITVAGFFSDKINDTKLNIDVQNNQLEIFSANTNSEDNKSYIKMLESTGKSFKADFNYKYILDGARNADSDEINLSFNDPIKMVISSVSDNSYLYILMPLLK